MAGDTALIGAVEIRPVRYCQGLWSSVVLRE